MKRLPARGGSLAKSNATSAAARSAAVVAASSMIFVATLFSATAFAADVTVRVTVERIRALDNFGTDVFPEDADFYAVITINGEEFDNKNTPSQDAHEDDNDITPNWEFSKSVDSAAGNVPVTIRVFDEDGFLRGDDDHADLDPGAGRDLELSVTIAPCGITGDTPGGCNTPLISGGNTDDSAEVTFRIEVVEPVSAPGLRIRCTHTPLWPQPGDTIAILAEPLDGSLAAIPVTDTVEIWVNSTAGPAQTQNGVASSSLTVGPFAGPSFSYGCRITESGTTIFSGWRTVQIGNPASGRGVPVITTGPRASRIDIAIVADQDSYANATAAGFLTDAASVITGAYYGYDLFLTNQDKFNFWLALDQGDAEDDCDHSVPGNWDDDYGFIEAGAIIHTDSFRDCALLGDRIFSSEPGSLMTVLHETGHQPFGLADEYCCDGGYFQTDEAPNVYEEPSDCAADAPSLGRTAADCREFTEVVDWWFDSDWSVSDPPGNDLMEDSGSRAPQAADARRINLIFSKCAAAGC